MEQAQTPALDALKAAGPRRWRLLKAHGTAVGLPSDADMGNSEVGMAVGLFFWFFLLGMMRVRRCCFAAILPAALHGR